jgi:transmembrane sensor
MEHKRAQELLDKYLEGNCTPEEEDLVESWYLMETEDPEAFQSEPDYGELGKSIWKSIQQENNRTRKLVPYYKWVAAAAVFVILGAGLYYLVNNAASPVQSNEHFAQNDITPGGNKAFLTLADGKRIVLDDAKNGEIAEQTGVIISKTADGQLVYTVSGALKSTKQDSKMAGFNTIETPKGGQYQINLPDGTKVWLNANSSLRYPAQFAAAKREVELKGEAYFEVAKRTIIGKQQGKRLPFVVKTSSQEVEVLGTHFNINSYQEEGNTKTTLLEGSVAVHPLSSSGISVPARIIKPGEQSMLNASTLKVSTVDTEQVLAWKEGFFMFDDEDLQSIMYQVARWYDVEVEFKDNSLKSKDFSGTVSRFANVSQVLKKIELTGSVHFKIEGRRIVVMK